MISSEQQQPWLQDHERRDMFTITNDQTCARLQTTRQVQDHEQRDKCKIPAFQRRFLCSWLALNCLAKLCDSSKQFNKMRSCSELRYEYIPCSSCFGETACCEVSIESIWNHDASTIVTIKKWNWFLRLLRHIQWKQKYCSNGKEKVSNRGK